MYVPVFENSIGIDDNFSLNKFIFEDTDTPERERVVTH